MKVPRITVKGKFTRSNTVSCKIIRTTFTGEGAFDFTQDVIFEGTTSKAFTEEEFDEYDDDCQSTETAIAKWFISEFNLTESVIQIDIY